MFRESCLCEINQIIKRYSIDCAACIAVMLFKLLKNMKILKEKCLLNYSKIKFRTTFHISYLGSML